MQEYAKHLHRKYGWNVIPVYFINRLPNGKKKVKTIEWKKYLSEPYDLNNWDDSYKALSIATGPISDLSVIDVDSQEAMDTILNSIGGEITDLAEYVVQTTKGYQLFYKYSPDTRTRIGIQDHIDFLSGGVTFAVETNQGYTLLKDNPPKEIPQELYDLIIGSEEEISHSTDFETAIRENSELPYKNPLRPIIKEFVESGKIGKHIKAKLEKVFCHKDFANYDLEDFSKEGQKYSAVMHGLGIVASSPTVEEELFLEFAEHWTKRVVKIDLSDPQEQLNLKNRIAGGLKIFRYDDEWKSKSDQYNQPEKATEVLGTVAFYETHSGKYVIYNKQYRYEKRYNKGAFQEAVVRLLRESNPEYEGKSKEIDPAMFGEYTETFDPTSDFTFMKDDTNERMYYNTFSRSPMLKHFQTCTPSKTLSPFLQNLLIHLYPITIERDMFLHTLAYHMTYLQVSPTSYILTGKSGTGKNMLLQGLLSGIYGDMHETVAAKTLTGKFRDKIKNKLLVFIDEVSEKGNNRPTEQGSLHNVIKQIVGNPMMSIESKGRDETNYPNHALYVMASNQEVPFRLEEGFDRRISITNTKDDNLRDLSWFPSHLSTKEIDDLVQSEVKGFVEYLASIDLDNTKWSKTVDNKQRQNLIRASVPLIEQYVTSIVDLDADALFDLDHDLGEWFEKTFIKDGKSYCTLRDLKTHLGDIGARVIKHLKPLLNCKLIDGQRSIVINPKGSSSDFKPV